MRTLSFFIQKVGQNECFVKLPHNDNLPRRCVINTNVYKYMTSFMENCRQAMCNLSEQWLHEIDTDLYTIYGMH